LTTNFTKLSPSGRFPFQENPVSASAGLAILSQENQTSIHTRFIYTLNQTIMNRRMKHIWVFLVLSILGTAKLSAQNMTILGNTTVKVLSNTTLTINGDLTIASNGNLDNAGTVELNGDWINNGNGLINGSTGEVVLNGSAEQTIGGSNATTFHDLTIDNSAGVDLTAPSMGIAGTLDIDDAMVTTNSNFVNILDGGALTRTTGWIFGNLQKYVPAGSSSRTYEVGNTSSYTPATFGFSGVSTPGGFRVDAVAGAHPNAASGCFDGSNFIGQYWNTSTTGVSPLNYSATFNYTAAEVAGTPDYSLVKIGRYSSGAWSFPAVNGVPSGTQASTLGGTGTGAYFIGQGNVEICGNGIDDNCDGNIDEGCGACTGIPSPGATTTTESLVCPGVPFTIGISNTLVGTNYSFVFQQSANSWGPWTNVQTGANPVLNVSSVSSTVWYRVRVNCLSSGQTGIASPVQVSLAAFCGPSFSSPSSSTNTDVLGVTVNGNYRNTDCSANAPGPGSQIGVYGNYLTLPSLANLVRGADGTFDIEVGSCGPDYNPSRIAIYIDFNQDGQFDAVTEEVYEQPSDLTGPDTRSGIISVPIDAPTGNTIMRIIIAEGVVGDITPTTGFTNGEVEDHIVRIVNPAVANDYYENATPVTTGAYPVCSATFTANLATATDSPESANGGNDVWYTFTAVTNAAIVTLTGSSDMLLELHDTNGFVVQEDAVTANGNETLIYDNLTPGQQYFISVEAMGTPGSGNICFSHLRRSGCDNPTSFNSPCQNFKNAHTAANVYDVTWDDNGVAPFIATSQATGGATLHLLANFVGLPPMTSTVNYLVRVDATYFLQNAAGSPVTVVVPGVFNCTRTVSAHPSVFLRSTDASPNVKPANAQIAAQQWVCAAFYEWNIQQYSAINGDPIAPFATVVNGPPANRFLTLGPLGLAPNGIYKVNIRPHFTTGAGNLGPNRWLLIAGPAGMVVGDDVEESLEVSAHGPSMLVYPNPTNTNLFTIALRDLTSENALVRVIDQTGRIVVSREYKGLNTTYSTIVMDDFIASGVYSVEVVQGDNVQKRSLIVTR
jgi:hypothetical protein